MPSKNREKRKESYRQWFQRHKTDPEFRKKRQARQKAYAKIEAKNCSVEGCLGKPERHHVNYDEPLEVMLLCKTHHELCHHKFDKCNVCGGKILARGLCSKHYKLERKKDPIHKAHVNEVLRQWRRKNPRLQFSEL